MLDCVCTHVGQPLRERVWWCGWVQSEEGWTNSGGEWLLTVRRPEQVRRREPHSCNGACELDLVRHHVCGEPGRTYENRHNSSQYKDKGHSLYNQHLDGLFVQESPHLRGGSQVSEADAGVRDGLVRSRTT